MISKTVSARVLGNLLLFGTVGGVLGAADALAQTPPLSPEFLVNSSTTGDQKRPAVAIDKTKGSFVVTWNRPGPGSAPDVAGRAFHADGTPKGLEVLVNTYTTGFQAISSVAGNSEGQIVVVWDSDGQDGDNIGVFGQRFDSSGAVGSEFQVNTYTTGAQYIGEVAEDASGNFVVVWSSDGQDGHKTGVFAQRFDDTGARVGSEFQVNTYTSDYQNYPSLAMDGSGNFVVVWQSNGQDGFKSGIFGRRYDSSGSPRGAEFQINVTTTGYQNYPRIASDTAGNFTVVWQSTYFDGSGEAVVARRFDSSGNSISGELLVNTHTTSAQVHPDIAMDSVGNFLVVWQSKGQDDPAAGADFGVFARSFASTGRPSSVEFPVNTVTSGNQLRPSVSISDVGQFVIAWHSEGQDGSGYAIIARRGGFPPPASLNVDVHSASGTSSDTDGVLEPGETVLVEPLWRNTSAAEFPMSGTASNFTGPAGPTYTAVDASADYGSLAAGATSDCHATTGNCYEFGLSAPASRPATHWDAQFTESLTTVGVGKVWTLHVGDSFTDVPRTQPFYKKIETLLHNGITSGCTTTTYCPGDPVSRGSMAIFIAKGIAGTAALVPASATVGAQPYNCTAGGTSLFTDVQPTDIFCKHVHYIAAQNVTLGCNAGEYCPNDTVTRIQMASFIAKAIVAPGGGPAVPTTYGPDPVTGFSYSCDTGSPNIHFTDVPASDPFCKHVHFLWAKGIISGCGATTYCPGDAVTRDAMAKFLDNAFQLLLYGP